MSRLQKLCTSTHRFSPKRRAMLATRKFVTVAQSVARSPMRTQQAICPQLLWPSVLLTSCKDQRGNAKLRRRTFSKAFLKATWLPMKCWSKFACQRCKGPVGAFRSSIAVRKIGQSLVWPHGIAKAKQESHWSTWARHLFWQRASQTQ